MNAKKRSAVAAEHIVCNCTVVPGKPIRCYCNCQCPGCSGARRQRERSRSNLPSDVRFDTPHRDFERLQTGELRECDGCRDGLVERVAEDYAPDTGVSYKPVNGSTFDSLTRDWLCSGCSAALDHGDA